MELDLGDFAATMKNEEVMYLATSAQDSVSIRPVSPLMGERNTVYFYTSKDSRKYKQMRDNPQVALSLGAVGRYQAEGKVRFLGGVFAEDNTELQGAYRDRYKGAFEVAAPGEVMESNEFIAIDLSLIKGWIFDKENPAIPIGQGEIHFS